VPRVYTSEYPPVEEILGYVAEHAAPDKRVDFIEAVPKSASGKILRRQLRDREQEPGT
jgi:acyl-coenzyme A synthetase/AMP-(fatty) acid ligase